MFTMVKMILNKSVTSVILVVALALLPVWPVAAKDGEAPAPQGATGNPALKLQPAVITPGATKAMMVSSARAGKRLVAVGDHGIVLLSDDEGKSFRQAKSVPVRVTLTSVSFIDDRSGWASGQWGVIVTTGDGGENWTLQRSDTTVDQPLFSIYFKDKDRGWAAGLWSLVLATKDGGKNWSAVKLPPPPGGGKPDRNLQRIFADKKGTVYIAAEKGTVVRSADDGVTWIYSQTGYKGSFWTGIALNDGSLLVGGLRGTIYRSIDNGKSWKEVPSGVKSSITDFAEADGKVYAVGLDGVSLVSSTNGASFTMTQREDRIPFTTLAVTSSGRPVAFSKQGVVSNFPDEKAK
jgi:photosystem II stability/assembly factor-like uncharacterized protein